MTNLRVTVFLRSHLIVVVVALVCQNEEIWCGSDVEAVGCIAPHHWLDDLGQWQQVALPQYCVCDSVSVINLLMFRVVCEPLLLRKLNLRQVVLLDLLQVVES